MRSWRKPVTDRMAQVGRPAFRPAERRTISAEVLDQLIAKLRSGELRPGQRLPTEAELAADLRVGRSTVREAMRTLIALGLVETKTRRGTIVTQRAEDPLAFDAANGHLDRLRQWALLDLLELREALEGLAAARAALRATDADIKAIVDAQRAVEADIAEGRTYFDSNVRFHQAIAHGAHNPLLYDSMTRVSSQVRGFRERLMREIRDMPERDVREHAAIVTAIREKRPERARAAMAAHIRSFAALVRRAADDLARAS